VRAVPHATFVFLGRDDMNGAVQARARVLGLDDKVHFAGYCPDVGPWMERASLFVLPSRDEGAPTSILEAQAHALPVVAYPCGGVPEVVRHGEDGLVAGDLRNESLAAAIVELLRDEARARGLGEAGRAKVVKEFSLEACSRLHAGEWRALAAR
jgi:glycosyltransferase involved in cell wall biosynthesis